MSIAVDEKGCVEFVIDKNTHSEHFSVSEAALLRLVELGSPEAVEAQAAHQALVDNFGLTLTSRIVKISRFDPLLVQVVKELGTAAGVYLSELVVVKLKLEQFLIRSLEYPASCNVLKQAYNKQGKKEDFYE